MGCFLLSPLRSCQAASGHIGMMTMAVTVASMIGESIVMGTAGIGMATGTTGADRSTW